MKGLLEWNFPGLKVETRKYVPPGLEGELGDESSTAPKGNEESKKDK